MSIASNSCVFLEFGVLFLFFQTLFFWLCMPRHRGRIGNPLSKKKDVIYVATCAGWLCWLLHECALQLCIARVTK